MTFRGSLPRAAAAVTIRKLDGHDLGTGDESCDVSGCDEYAAHAIGGANIAGWICERHVEQSPLIAECAVCGALTIGDCADDHGLGR